ncbi:hypothetical protein [Blastococcus brunescens]|uniref:Uncharacterized protein n=1 Tax=Blastococcus brunescens TaxID=1564165 RepID=A0ABZ1B9K6_9ACTN|nr:hypothetical protein [Blastococcus sp. BMG 8361]WRL66109.1 hypothetical protein U6N30_11620 [Blastococcus sp. BMG 8361]
MAVGTLAACGSDDGGADTLTWYINPDAGGQVEIASRCTEEAGVRTGSTPRSCRVSPPSSASSWSAGSPPRTPRSTS